MTFIIKTTNDKDVSAPEIKKLQDISNEIINIIQEGVIRQSYLQQSGNVTELINKYGGGNIRIIKRKTTKGLETQIEKLKHSKDGFPPELGLVAKWRPGSIVSISTRQANCSRSIR